MLVDTGLGRETMKDPRGQLGPLLAGSMSMKPTVGQSAVVQAEKGVAQSQASLKRYQTNLGYCTIRSPVKGVIIDRRVNIGQTVVASLNAPSLFLIAKDLKRMQVWVAVNEADIGQIHVNQKVNFTVDAYPNDVFTGTVGKIRLNANVSSAECSGAKTDCKGAVWEADFGYNQIAKASTCDLSGGGESCVVSGTCMDSATRK